MERLQKVIANAGVTSRRKAEQLIVEGRVKVNNQIVKELGTKVTAKDKIEVDGIPLEHQDAVYYLLYKPTGVISSASDEKGRKVVIDYIEDEEHRLYPVGRLDYDTSGLIIITNDGEFSNLLMHPKHKIEKSYIAKIDGIPSKETIRQLQKGIRLEDGMTAPAKVKVRSIDKKKTTSIVEVTIHEGRNRQVRRMFEAIGCRVKKLKRERYGFLTLEGLQPGEYRELKSFEVNKLKQLAVTQMSQK